MTYLPQDKPLFVFVKVFDNYDQCNVFLKEFGKKPMIDYFKYVEDCNEKCEKYISKSSMTKKEKFNLLFKKKQERQTEEDKKKNKDQYVAGQLTRLKYENLPTKNTKYYLEKQLFIQIDQVQIYCSQLFLLKNGDTFNDIKERIDEDEKYMPTKSYVYFAHQKEFGVKNFIQNLGEDKGNLLVKQFLNEIGNNLLSLNKEITSFSNLCSQVNGLTKDLFHNVLIPDIDEFQYTIKTDGVRALLVVDDQKNQYKLSSSKSDIFTIKRDTKYTIYDCEEYEDTFYIFDIMMANGKDIMQKSYSDRLKEIDNTKIPKNCKKKTFYKIKKLTDLKLAFQRVYEGVKADGVIIVRMSKTYQQTEAYKLKDRRFLTNDFLLKQVDVEKMSGQDKRLLNIKSSDVVYKLYVGAKIGDFAVINHDNPQNGKYQPMLFALPYFKVQPTEYMIINSSFIKYVKELYDDDPEVNETLQHALEGKYDDMIVECAYNENLQPYPIRFRQDKTDAYKTSRANYGNNFGTALANYNNIMDPITFDYIKNPETQSYFNVENPDSKYDYLRQFGRDARKQGFNKTLQLVKEISGQQAYMNALDIGAGRNADYWMFLQNKFNTVIAYEPDVRSNITYYSRIFEQIKTQHTKKIPLTYIVNQYPIEAVDVMKQLSIYKINFFQSNYAIHYLCDSEKSIKALKKFLLSFAQEKAIFHFTDNDGKRYYDLMQKDDGTYDNGKYFIQLHKPEEKFQKFGQKVDVMMPWISKTMTTEYLMNIKAIEEVFKPEIKLIKTVQYIKQHDDVPEEDQDYLSCLCSYFFQIENERE